VRKEKGFSLIELLIVVAIILIIAAIAIPNLMRARMAANESSAAAAVRTINSGQGLYQQKFQTTKGYAATLVALGPSSTAAVCVPDPAGVTGDCDIDGTLATGVKGGYTFVPTVVVGGGLNTGYTITASPTTPNQTGSRWFCSFTDGVVRGATAVIAACNGTVLPI
jgi:prepilin-type N-terminal cleavage/methylation domain-containing protein